MKTHIQPYNSRTWEWEITADDGTHLRGGFSRRKGDAKNDADIVLASLQADEARAAGRIARGDIVTIKAEWRDPGDDSFTFRAAETQLEGMTSIRISSVHTESGQPSIGVQSIQVSMLER